MVCKTYVCTRIYNSCMWWLWFSCSSSSPNIVCASYVIIQQEILLIKSNNWDWEDSVAQSDARENYMCLESSNAHFKIIRHITHIAEYSEVFDNIPHWMGLTIPYKWCFKLAWWKVLTSPYTECPWLDTNMRLIDYLYTEFVLILVWSLEGKKHYEMHCGWVYVSF